jgi:hypothetical protein
MAILIGMDEAGYGPILGPLVVAATAWEVPDEGSGDRAQVSQNGDSVSTRSNGAATVLARRTSRPAKDNCADLYRLLRNIVAKRASERRIAIADSKALYHPGQGLRQLERGLHSVLQTLRQSPACWSHIIDYCGADGNHHYRRVCWPEGFDCALPVDAPAQELARLAARFERACDTAAVRPLAIRAKLVFPEQFNELVAYYGTKGGALSHVTVGLLRELMDLVCGQNDRTGIRQLPSVYAVCDKHGGRNYYTALLQHHFSEHWIVPLHESHAESRYEWGPPSSPVRVTFRVHGESFMPTALASMTAKYLRELAMRAFNAFWAMHVPGLRPTAGYYRDAWRFKRDIALKQRELGIDHHLIWRAR